MGSLLSIVFGFFFKDTIANFEEVVCPNFFPPEAGFLAAFSKDQINLFGGLLDIGIAGVEKVRYSEGSSDRVGPGSFPGGPGARWHGVRVLYLGKVQAALTVFPGETPPRSSKEDVG